MNTVHELAWWTIDECSWMFMNIHQHSSLDELHLTGVSSIWPSTKHYLEATNRLHRSSISAMYSQRFWRWPIFNQFRAKVACFLAHNAWYPCLCEQLSHLNRWPALRHIALWRMERGVARGTHPPLFNIPKTSTRSYKAYEPKYL